MTGCRIRAPSRSTPPASWSRSAFTRAIACATPARGSLGARLGIRSPGPAAGGVAEDGEPVGVRAWVDSPTYAWFQRLHLTVEVETRAGWHVYGRPAPEGMIPLEVEVAPIAGLEVGATEEPAPRRFAMAGLDETLWVHAGPRAAGGPT